MNKNIKLKDRVALILTALVCSGLMVLFIVYVEPRFSEEWSKFIFASISYFVVLIATAFKAEQLKRLSKAKILLFMVVFYVLTVSIAYLVFRYGFLPLPRGTLTYVFPMVALSVASLIVLGYLRKRLKFFKTDGNGKIRRKRGGIGDGV